MFNGRMWIFWGVVGLIIFVLGVMNVYAQSDMNVGTFQGNIRSLNFTIFNLLKNIMSLALFAVAVWQFVDGYVQHQLQSKWLSLLGIAIFILVLNLFPTIYNGVMGLGNNAGVTDGGTDWLGN